MAEKKELIFQGNSIFRSNNKKLSRFLFPLLLILVISILQPSFFTIGNGLNILRISSILFILAAGQTLVILTEGIDLSVGSVVGLTGCIAGSLIIKNGHNIQGILVAMILGSLIGLLNGLIISKIKIPAFIATYGMMMVARGFTIAFMKGEVYWGFNDTFRFLGAGSIGSIPIPILLALFVFIIIYFILNKTNFGRSIYYIGNNKKAALMSGIDVQKILILVYTLEGLIASLGGLIYLSRLNSAEASLGTGFETDAIAAVIIGGTSFFNAEGNLSNAFIGAITISLLRNAMNLLGISSYWQPLIIGFLIVMIVASEKIPFKLGKGFLNKELN